MTPVKTEMLRLYKNYEDVIEYFNYEFPKVLAKKMFDIGEGSYNFTLSEIDNLLSLKERSNLDFHDYYLITTSLGYNVKKIGCSKNVTLTFYL